jgi:FtsZ-interacting cell division protein ZipA
LLKSDTVGDFSEIAACLLLANRGGAATVPLLEAFVRAVTDVAASLPAAVLAPDVAAEAARAEALDRICADLDVQIGITVLKTDGAMILGTRLRGIAEAAGFKLAEGGRFDWVQEETGAVLYALQNYRSEPFTADTLRVTSTPGAVFLLDVPRVAEPVRVYDQMKLGAKRMAQTLGAILVDDNRRALDDAALNAIRDQVRSTAAALREVHIEPGSPRAQALFGG